MKSVTRMMLSPAVGSFWRGRDGRIFKVIYVCAEQIGDEKPYAEMMVMNPARRGRSMSKMQLTNFTSKEWSCFLSPCDEQGRLLETI